MKTHQVWRYDGKRLRPIDVGTGLADVQWTEIVSRALHSGDALVTNAVLGKD